MIATEIIFDQNHLDFKTIIQALKQIKTKVLPLKFFLKSSDFIIGSNSSFDRGEVVKI